MEKITQLPPLVELVKTVGSSRLNTEEALRQLNVSDHDVFDKAKRKKKEVMKPTGAKDANGEDVLQKSFEEVNRIALPLQELILNRRVAFMNVRETKLSAITSPDSVEERMFQMVQKTRDDNKIEYMEDEVASRLLSELECAKLWFSESVNEGYWGELSPNAKYRMRVKILSPKLGDKLYPVFNSLGDMVYFGREYKERIDLSQVPLEELTPEDFQNWNKEIQKIDIYSNEYIYKFEEIEGGWLAHDPVPNPYGKIPVIYYCTEKAPWSNVQPCIDRLETLLSNFADTNDYFGSPMLKAKGTIKGMASKGDRGKIFQLEKDADIEYITWDQAPAAVQLEIETLIDFIYTCTQTPNISFKEMKGLGGTSGVAFDRIFIDAILAAKKEISGGYGLCTQRDINFLKSAMVRIDNTLKPALSLRITYEIPVFKINDETETIQNIAQARIAGIISQESATKLNPLIENGDEEFERIKSEQDTLGNDFDDQLEQEETVRLKRAE